MKKEKKSYVRSGPEAFVRITKRLFIVLSVVALPALMVLLALAVNTRGAVCVGYACAGGALAVCYFVLYGFYALHVSMGTVLGIELTDKVVHLHTDRKTYTYDVRMGCVAVTVKRNRFLCTFETQDSRDKFIFYKHAPFSKYTDGQFTEADVAAFCPAFEGEDYQRDGD